MDVRAGLTLQRFYLSGCDGGEVRLVAPIVWIMWPLRSHSRDFVLTLVSSSEGIVWCLQGLKMALDLTSLINQVTKPLSWFQSLIFIPPESVLLPVCLSVCVCVPPNEISGACQSEYLSLKGSLI